MVKIELEFECLAPNGECHYKSSPNICITYIGEKSMWICDCLMVTRKKEEFEIPEEVEQKLLAQIKEDEAYEKMKKEKASQSNGGEKHAI